MRITLKAPEIRNAIERASLTRDIQVLHVHGELTLEFSTKDALRALIDEMLKPLAPPEEV